MPLHIEKIHIESVASPARTGTFPVTGVFVVRAGDVHQPRLAFMLHTCLVDNHSLSSAVATVIQAALDEIGEEHADHDDGEFREQVDEESQGDIGHFTLLILSWVRALSRTVQSACSRLRL